MATDIPAAIAAKSKTAVLTVHGKGVQIYECTPDPAGGAKWKFREPLATLIKDGKTVGHHFAGPGWALASGSAVTGKADAQSPGGTAKDIALLRLDVVDKRGGGELSDVTTIQRLDTLGGVFSGACDKPGSLHLEPYSAEYVFLRD